MWKEKDWIWFAGFMDGEGTFTINSGIKRNGKTNKEYTRLEPRISVSGNDKGIISHIAKVLNVTVKKRMQVNMLYTIDFKKQKKIVETLRKLIPFLKLKKKHALLLLIFCESRINIIKKSKNYKTQSYTENEFNIYFKLKELNRRGAI